MRASGDALGRPFAIVDKQSAQLVLFNANGHEAARSAVLLGRDRGDHSVPGVGERTQAGTLKPGDATTPAGRFSARLGRNQSGETVVWVDLEAAFAIHRLRPGPDRAGRQRRLASRTPQDNRASAGCVVIDEAFFTGPVQALWSSGPAPVYVLPEDGDVQAFWAGLRRPAAQAL